MKIVQEVAVLLKHLRANHRGFVWLEAFLRDCLVVGTHLLISSVNSRIVGDHSSDLKAVISGSLRRNPWKHSHQLLERDVRCSGEAQLLWYNKCSRLCLAVEVDFRLCHDFFDIGIGST